MRRSYQKNLNKVVGFDIRYTAEESSDDGATLVKMKAVPKGDGETIGAITFGDLQSLRTRAEILDGWQKGCQEIAQAPRRKKSFDDEAREEGTMPDPDKTQAVLWSRQRYKDYEKATFNFVFGIRDDPGLAQTRNDWCLQYGNGGDTFDT